MERIWSVSDINLEENQYEDHNNICLNLKSKRYQKYLDTNDKYFSVHNVNFPEISRFSESII